MEIAIIPKFLIINLTDDYYKQNDYNILLSNILIIIFFAFFGNVLLPILSQIPHFCLIDKLTGIECPVCGTTRAFCEISGGNFYQAYTFNKTSLLVALFFISQLPLRLISLLKIAKTKTVNSISKYFSLAILTTILINWIITLFTNY
ncbi:MULTISPECIES: DUF2752 domain-containing protein [Bizionia]|uniref:DUF2752 domain-containing protein n=1 Tax=Bizionia algoritergicola TaxID=291187 RepID=A0A5D0QX08_9FLAO|nr:MULTISPECIES: DUF2752 domain-containing protein [Bizionia]OBX22207.1 hypothetical protein BAA08_09695 [Bizionia sp. APA-3]TYB73221.1 DUF2752 domain-containing protein [Bizionia algoritergicola]